MVHPTAVRRSGKERVAFLLDLPRVHSPVSNLRTDDADKELAFAHHA